MRVPRPVSAASPLALLVVCGLAASCVIRVRDTRDDWDDWSHPEPARPAAARPAPGDEIRQLERELARLGAEARVDDARAGLEEARRALEEAQVALARFHEYEQPGRVAAAELAVTAAEQEVASMRRELEGPQQMPDAQVADLRAQLALAEGRLELERGERRRTLEGELPAYERDHEAEVARRERDVMRAERALHRAELEARLELLRAGQGPGAGPAAPHEPGPRPQDGAGAEDHG
jgi:hypothetical protein